MTFDELIKQIHSCNICKDSCNKEKDIYFYGTTAKIGMMMQNPAVGKANKTSNLDYYKKLDRDLDELINWIVTINNKFFKEFFNEIKIRGIIKYEDYNKYIKSKAIFNDIYFFDAVKCKMRTSDLKSEYFDECMKNIVYHELEFFENLELLFVFSTRAWEAFKKQYSPKAIDSRAKGSLAKVHGYLHTCLIKGRPVYVIPLVHMSPVSFNNLLRNSYFDYLREGLDNYARIK